MAGGAGFLGSHLCERLIREGNRVICVDNFLTGNMSNISHLMSNKNFRFMEHDIIDPFDIDVEQIYNLTCPASPVHYQHDPIHTVKTCVIGSINLLDIAKRTNARILLASTSEVYGNPLLHPQNEMYFGNVNFTGIRACYDEGKRTAETLFFDYHRQHNVQIKVMRIFNTYGPRMNCDDGRVVSNFVIQALSGQNITIYGDGSQTRSFCYVDDLIDGMVRFMNSSHEFVGPVNIRNIDEYTILQLAEIIIEMTCSHSSIVYKNLPKDDPVKRKPDIELARRKLSWSPTTSLQDGLANTIKYFKNKLNLEIK